MGDGTKYPHVHVKLTGENGNVYNLMGIVRLALRHAGVPTLEIDKFSQEVTEQRSYDAALQVMMRWVDVS